MEDRENGRVGIIILVAVLVVTVLFVAFMMFKNGFFGNDRNDPSEQQTDVVPEGAAPQNHEVDYQVTSLKLDTETMTAFVSTQISGACRVILQVMDDESFFTSSEEIAPVYLAEVYGEAALSMPEGYFQNSGVESIDTEISVSGELPQYFVVEACIVDETGAPLSAPFYTIKHSRRYETFMKTTPSDFSETENIVFFGAEEANNFGVLADGVKVVNAKALKCKRDDQDFEYYEIVSPDVSIASGDKIYVSDGENAALFQAWITETEGETVMVQSMEYRDGGYHNEVVLSDFYKFIKYDSALAETEENTEESAESSVAPLSYIKKPIDGSKDFDDILFNLTYGDAIGTDNDNDVTVTVKGKISNGHAEIHGYIIYGPAIFESDYYEAEIDASIRFILNADITASTGSDSKADSKVFEIDRIGKIPIPTPIIGLMIKAEFSTGFAYEISGTVSIDSMPFDAKVAFRYSTVEGYKSKGNQVNVGGDSFLDYITCNADAIISFGPIVTLGVEYINGLLDFSADAKGILYLQLSADGVLNYNLDEPGIVHKCALCIDCSLNFDFSIDASLSTRITKKLKWTHFRETLFQADYGDIAEFYISLAGENGKPGAGMGNCPNFVFNVLLETECLEYDEFVCDSYEVDSGGYFTKQEECQGNYGEHDHILLAYSIQVVDNKSGKTLCDRYVPIDRDDKDEILREPRIFVEIPFACKDVHVRVECKCKVYECRQEYGLAGGGYWYDVVEDSVLEVTYPSFETTHVVEYDFTHDFVSGNGDHTLEYAYGPFAHTSGTFEYTPVPIYDATSYLLDWNSVIRFRHPR